MAFVKVRMLHTQRGSPDGVHVHVYEQGQTYELPSSLAGVFIVEQWAEAVMEEQPEPATQPEADAAANALPQTRQTAKGRARK